MTDTDAFVVSVRQQRWSGPVAFRSLLYLTERAVDLQRRGVIPVDRVRAHLLRRVALQFVAGYNAMLEPRPLQVLDAQLAEVEPPLRGILIEGAGMGASIRDALSWRGGLLRALTEAHGARHEYLIAVGAGWGCARVPWRWRSIRSQFDPLLAGLCLDGRGFHDTYFHPRRAATGRIGRYRGARARAYDAGIGRAVWFLASGHVPTAIGLVNSFAETRRADLLAGMGLAMAFAGPTTAKDWMELRSEIDPAHWPDLGQGICFAAEAMRRAGATADTTAMACADGLGMGCDAAADIAASSRPGNVTEADAFDAYDAWRSSIRDRLRLMGAGR